MTAEFIVNHLWQSSCFVLLAGLLAVALRNSPPKVRYWIWLSASLKFLVPLALLMSLGSMVPRPAKRVAWATDPVPFIPNAIIQIAEPFTPTSYSAVPAHAPTHWLLVAIGIVWAFGFLVVASVRCRSWLRIRVILRASMPIDLPIPVPAFIAPGDEEPGVVGFLRPALVLPAQLLELLNPRQLHAVLTHEMCHVRRRDNFFAAVHMVVEAIFWFNPLVWWIGSRMVEEREQACDQEVLRMGCEPADYVEGILKVCRFYTESPLPCVSGVTGADVKKRVHAILSGSIAHELNAGKKVALALIGLATLGAPVVIGVLNAPAIRGQNAVPANLKFEVASIKPCELGHGPVSFGITPGLLKMHCLTVKGLIGTAYVTNAEPSTGTVFARDGITGGPAWLSSDAYDIEAKAEGNASGPVMAGPMLRALLEDRFKLKLHSETRQIPVYELTVAKSGFRLKPLPEGSCTPFDAFAIEPQGLTQEEARAAAAQRCNWFVGSRGKVDGHAASLDQFAAQLSHM